jgi:hypothetical protein
MIRGEFCDRLLQEVDIALQATGPPLHGLFDGADFGAGNILRMNARREGCHQQRGNQFIPGGPGNHQVLTQNGVRRTRNFYHGNLREAGGPPQ